MVSLPLDPVVWASENVKDHFNARCIAIAGFTLVIWTHLTTLDEEKQYIWNNGAGVTLNKILFFTVRYFATITIGFVLFESGFAQFLADIIIGFTASHCSSRDPALRCQGMIVFVGAAGLGLMAVSDVILLLRTWAIYHQTRKSIICLGILFGITHLPTIVIGSLWMTSLSIGPSKLYPVISGCFVESTAPDGFWRVVAPSVVFNTVLSGASMHKIWSYRTASIKTPLISLLVYDGMLYYVIILSQFGMKFWSHWSCPHPILGVYLCNGFFLFNKRLVAITIEGRFILCVIAVTCALLQLHLRIAVYHVPETMATYSQPRVIVRVLNRRPRTDTLSFGDTTTELETSYDSPSTERFGLGQEGRRNSHAIEVVTTSVHVAR